jgi:hypothetical protein
MVPTGRRGRADEGAPLAGRGRAAENRRLAGRGRAAAGDVRRQGWLDVLRDASDLALLGILVTVGALAVVTAPAAVATASVGLHHWRRYGHWPGAREILRRYLAELLPGVPVGLLVLASAALLTLNAGAFASGAVPGGTALVALTALLAAGLAGYAALVVVEAGRDAGTGADDEPVDRTGWRAAVRRANRAARDAPLAVAALAGVTTLAAGLAWAVIPVATPILAGYLLFAQHAVAHRMLPDSTA